MTISVGLFCRWKTHISFVTALVEELTVLGAECILFAPQEFLDHATSFRPGFDRKVQCVTGEGKEYGEMFALLREKSKTLNLLIIDETMDGLGKLAKLQPECKAVYILHNVHTWFKPRISFRPLDWWRYRMMKKVISHYNALAILGENQKRYIEKSTKYRRPVFRIPCIIFDEAHWQNKKQEANSRVVFAVPGGIYPHRRDYETLFQAVLLLSRECCRRVELIFVGGPGRHGSEILNRFRALSKLGILVQTYKGYVPFTEFDLQLKRTDVLLAPVLPFSKSPSYIEQSGITKITGAVIEQIRYALPAVFPKSYAQESELKSSTLFYEDARHIATLMKEMIQKPERLETMRVRALENSRRFTRKRLRTFLQDEMLPSLLLSD